MRSLGRTEDIMTSDDQIMEYLLNIMNDQDSSGSALDRARQMIATYSDLSENVVDGIINDDNVSYADIANNLAPMFEEFARQYNELHNLFNLQIAKFASISRRVNSI